MEKSLVKPNYSKFSLHDLLVLIVVENDLSALQELHDKRTVFQYGHQSRLLLAEYLKCLKDSTSVKGSCQFVDQAYDYTIDKFSNIPKMSVCQKYNGKSTGPDCRKYYQAIVNDISKESSKNLLTDLLSARKLQGLVTRHFFLSLREIKRSSHSSRYNWKLPNGSISVTMPKSISGSRRLVWLQQNITDPNPKCVEEQQRIQEIINQRLGTGEPVYLDNSKLPGWCVANAVYSQKQRFKVNGVDFIDTVAEAVAEEKSQRISLQRKAIKVLGKQRLKTMILRIFEDLGNGNYKDIRICTAYGISKATFSRFAGSRWNKNIPDLWSNLAQVIATNHSFIETARNAGVWDRINHVHAKSEEMIHE